MMWETKALEEWKKTEGRGLRTERFMNRILLGALAGVAATGPMTLAMRLMHEQLPREERYPLPPRQVTEGLAEKAGVNEDLDEEEREAAAWASAWPSGPGATWGGCPRPASCRPRPSTPRAATHS